MSTVPIDPARLPRHVAVIMDGNGRWAVGRGEARVQGHLRGSESVRAIITEAARLGLSQITLYCFSAENWKRPPEEVAFLMQLLREYLVEERPLILEQNIRFRVIGRRVGVSPEVLAEIDRSERLSAANTGLTLCLAINYGGRAELVDAMQSLARRVAGGSLSPEAITEDAIDGALYTAGMPDPDLLIRTAGEMRLSNYLLWQISYAEIWVTPVLWPDFTVEVFHQALRDFAARDRRFGGLENTRGAADAP